MPSLKNRTALRRPRTEVRNSAVSLRVSSTPTARKPRSKSVGSSRLYPPGSVDGIGSVSVP